MTTTNVKQPTTEDFRFEKHGAGAVGIAAKRIAAGETVSFDCFKIVKDENNFLAIRRDFLATHYFGLLDLKEGIKTRSIALRVSHCSDLDAHKSHSIIASWTPKEITSDPVFIAAELMGFLCNQYDNYFIND